MKKLLIGLLAGMAAFVSYFVVTSTGKPKWESEIREFERQDSLARPPSNAVLFVGSSSIRLWKTLAGDFPHQSVINRGFGGSQLSDVIAAADRIIIPYQPRKIVLYCGDNDITAGHKSPAQVLAGFQTLVAQLHRNVPHTSLVYISMKPAPGTWTEFGAKMREGNRLIREYIATDPTLTYIDVFDSMLDSEGVPRRELFISDHEHMNATGYALWTSIIKPVVK